MENFLYQDKGSVILLTVLAILGIIDQELLAKSY